MPNKTQLSNNSPSRLDTLIYNLLVKSVRRHDKWIEGRFWDYLKRKTRSWNSQVTTVIHDRSVFVNFGYMYPMIARLYSTYNNPLVELVHQAFVSGGKQIRLVDIGAAIGDTVLLIDANCPDEVSDYVCVDGDKEFFYYLQKNLARFPKCKLIQKQLSRSVGKQRSLVRTHSGTASAQGTEFAIATPLDEVFIQHSIGNIDVLKIDVDGFDGEVLMGAQQVLLTQKPAVIFEWHPILCKQTGNDHGSHFEALHNAGYEKLIWFTKFGDFSHYGISSDRDSIGRLADLCLNSNTLPDWHYDVIALHPETRIDPIKVADLAFSKTRKSKF